MNPRCPQCGGQIGAFVNPDEPICICELAKRWRDGYRTRKWGWRTLLVGALLWGSGFATTMYLSFKMVGTASGADLKRPETLFAMRQQIEAAMSLDKVAKLLSAFGALVAVLGAIAFLVGGAMVYRKGDEVRWSDAFWPRP